MMKILRFIIEHKVITSLILLLIGLFVLIVLNYFHVDRDVTNISASQIEQSFTIQSFLTRDANYNEELCQTINENWRIKTTCVPVK